MRYASLKGQSHINIYVRLINYAQMRFLRLLCSERRSVLRRVPLQDSGRRPTGSSRKQSLRLNPA